MSEEVMNINSKESVALELAKFITLQVDRGSTKTPTKADILKTYEQSLKVVGGQTAERALGE